MRGLSPVAASGGHSSSRCAGLSLSRPRLLQSTGSRRSGSVVVAHGPSCSAACGILPDQGSNPCPLHWQADSQPLRHQGSPSRLFNSIITTNNNVVSHIVIACYRCKVHLQKWSQGTHVYHNFLFLWWEWMLSLSHRGHSGSGEWDLHLPEVIGVSILTELTAPFRLGSGCPLFNQPCWAVWQSSMVVLTFHRHSLSRCRQKEVSHLPNSQQLGSTGF